MRNVILTIALERDWDTTNTDAIKKVLPRFLDLLDKNRSKATFFVVSDLATKFPKQIKQIVKRGHEIGSHSHTHRHLNNIRFDELEQEVKKSKQVLDRLGCNVQGFRAPAGIRVAGLSDVLKRYKYTYNSSTIASWFPGRYNELANDKPVVRHNGLVELPIPNFTMFRIPAGLSYARLFHPFFTPSLSKQPYMVYMHLHEFLDRLPSNKIRPDVWLASYRNRGERAWKIFENMTKKHELNFITCNDYIKLNPNSLSQKRTN